MRYVFADTSFYVALLNRRDALREAALAFMERYTGKVLTTEFVLLELGNFLAQSARRSAFRPFVERLGGRSDTQILPVSSGLFRRGLELYSRRDDKQWSLTDCISFILMDEHAITEALTADHHFAQAGYTILLT